MVAKISSNSSLFGTINYNKLKLEKDEANVLFSRNMFEKQDGSFSFSLCMKSFEPYLAVNKRTEKPVFHLSLNPDPKDKLNDEQLSEIAEKYMESMGYGNQPYIVFKHTDIDRSHLHVVSIRVDETGKKIDSNFENLRSMNICRNLEQEYNLHPAEKKQRSYETPIKKVDYKRGDVKHQVSNIVKTIMNNYNFQSFGEFRTVLEIMNVTVEDVRGMNPQGQLYNGIVYSATDDNGKRIGTPFKSSLFGKQVGYNALLNKFEKSKQTVKEKGIRERLIPVIRSVMQSTSSKQELESLLIKENILPIFRHNEQGRLYGVTFIDGNSKTALNGFRLGKEFSANAFHELFTNPEKTQNHQEESKMQNHHTEVQEEMEQGQSVNLGLESLATGILDILPVNQNSYEENPQLIQPPKKKKKGLRL